MTDQITTEDVDLEQPELVGINEDSRLSAAGASPDTPDSPEQPADDAETFPRDYVLKLRDENAKYRQRAADRDEIAAKLHTALVAATGRLADPSDLPFDQSHLDDADALTAALDALLTAKPHLATRKPMGSIGQGVSGASDTFSLAGALRSNAS